MKTRTTKARSLAPSLRVWELIGCRPLDDKQDYDDNNAAIPSCKCNEPAAERTVSKDGDNKGRKFFTCSKGRDNGCDFFDWNDAGGGKVVPKKRAGGAAFRGDNVRVAFHLPGT